MARVKDETAFLEIQEKDERVFLEIQDYPKFFNDISDGLWERVSELKPPAMFLLREAQWKENFGGLLASAIHNAIHPSKGEDEKYDTEIELLKRRVEQQEQRAQQQEQRIDDLKHALDELLSGRGVQPFFGVALQKASGVVGLVVKNVIAGSPAEKYGVLLNDRLLKVDGVAVQNAKEYATTIRSKRPGDTIHATVMRGGREQVIPIILSLKPAGRPDSLPPIGMGLKDDNKGGLLVKRVDPNSPSDLAGIKPGDRLVSVAMSPLGPNKTFYQAISGSKVGDRVPFCVTRGEGVSLTCYVHLVDKPKPAPISIGLQFKFIPDSNTGLTVTTLQPGGPAARAGVKPGDKIMRVGGIRVHSNVDYFNVLSTKAPGESIAFELNRNGNNVVVQIVTVAKSGASPSMSPSQTSDEGQSECFG